MLRHLAEPLPLSFVAQIDLGEAYRLGDIAAQLPDSGRLLFFYDLAIGPWDDGPRSGRVIWDQSSVSDLQPAALPGRLQQLDAQARQEYIGMMKQHGFEPEADYNAGYLAPARPMRLSEHRSLRRLHTIEAKQQGDFDDIDVGDGDEPLSLYDLYSDFYPDEPDQPDTSDGTSYGFYGHHLLGSPDPEQNDPRYGPAFSDFLADRPESDDLRTAFFEHESARALDWQLLLQVDVATLAANTGAGHGLFSDTPG